MLRNTKEWTHKDSLITKNNIIPGKNDWMCVPLFYSGNISFMDQTQEKINLIFCGLLGECFSFDIRNKKQNYHRFLIWPTAQLVILPMLDFFVLTTTHKP